MSNFEMVTNYMNKSMDFYEMKNETVKLLRRQITGKVANIKDIEKLEKIKNEVDK